MLEIYDIKNNRLKEIEPDYEQYFGLIIDISTLCQLVPEFDIETEELKYGIKKVLEKDQSINMSKCWWSSKRSFNRSLFCITRLFCS